MTQTKLKSMEPVESKNKNDTAGVEKNLKSKYFNDKCIQIAAWILLTLGLCIIISTFYLAINQKVGNQIDEDIGLTDNSNERDKRNDINSEINVDIIAKTMSKKIFGIDNITFEGCEEKLCKIVCMQAENIYETLQLNMQISHCSSFDALMIYEQQFEHGVLRNNWKNIDGITVQELALWNCDIKKIKNAAFNTPMFSTVFLMYWRNLNLEIVESGALLGLDSLKYLMIDSKMNCLDRAFFQPVQTTLIYLKIHAGLLINKDESLFGISNLKNLEYADLSHNKFNSAITKNTFRNAPNLKYLILSKCQIIAIADDAFVHLAGKLSLLDLSHNVLTTLSDKTLQPILKSNTRSLVNVAMNSFACDCDIRTLVKVYKRYRNQFMEALYCKAPHQLYGKLIDEVELNKENCQNDEDDSDDDDDDATTTETTAITQSNSAANDDDDVRITILQSVTSQPATTIKTTTLKTTRTDGFANDFDVTDDSDSDTNLDTTENVQMRCWHSQDTPENLEPRSFSSSSLELSLFENQQLTPSNFNEKGSSKSSSFSSSSPNDNSAFSYPINSLRFAPPTHEFELILYENRSVKVEITKGHNVDAVNVVWFAEDVEDFHLNVPPCMVYGEPYIMTETLMENTTYTFCLIPSVSNGITPFNCLPLHVSAHVEQEDIWIPRDQKQFTIGMLTLLFFMSTFAGAVIAYFGIRAYPDLLEGSKNVLVVKKSDKTCYVSTISEADYMKKASLKKKSSNSSIQKFALLDTPATIYTPSIMNAAELDRLSSLKSSLTFFEDAFNPMPNLDDEYELPKPMRKEIIYEGRSIPNTYVATSPRRSPPPPLPKRNSQNSPATDYAF